MRGQAFLVVGLALAAVGACADSEVAPDAPEGELVETVRFPDHPEAPLTFVENLTAGPRGDVYVVDRQTPAVLQFGRDGEFCGKLGGEGEGPGEFRNPFYVGQAGDTLWVVDSRLQRVTLFDPGGNVLSTLDPLEGADLPEGLRSPTIVAYMRDGSVLVAGSPSPEFLRIHLAALAPKGETPIHLAALDAEARWWRIKIPRGGTSSNLHQPFGFDDLFAAWSPGSGAVVIERPHPPNSERGEYRVRMIGPDGTPVRSFRREYTPRRLTDPDVDAVLSHHVDGWFGESLRPLFPSREALRDAFDAGLTRMEFLPPITNDGRGILDRSVFVSAGGAVWLRRWSLPGEPQRWEILAPDGSEQSVGAPAGVTLHAARGDTAWGVVSDTLGVPTIVRYELRPEEAGT